MSIFTDNLKINKTFSPFFKRQGIEDELDKIEKVLLKEKPYKNQFYPYPHEVLRFATLNLDDIKYIILGMDPYPSDYIEDKKTIPVATGRSFEVRFLKSWLSNFRQTSLQNILKALYLNQGRNQKDRGFVKYTKNAQKNDKGKTNIPLLSNIKKEIENGTFDILPPPLLWDNFEKNGVMFLNSTLTVKPHLSNSHTSLWAHFVDELIKYILSYKKEKNQKNILWFIWGENARKRVEDLVDKKDMIITCHPASRTHNTFVKDNCFKYIK